jgi:hypothetical protein
VAQAIRYRPSLSGRLFHHSKAFIRGLRGPIGSGKSVTCVMELWRMAMRQAPDADGVRFTRFAVIRNTYPELKSTTIKTWQQWLPQSICPLKFDAPITGLWKAPHPDGKTSIHCEVIFIALDREEDAKKLLSLELTAAWINEARELSWGVVKMVRSRVGRYPQKSVAPLTQSGVILDTNPPDSDHWWYHLAEEGRIGDEAVSLEDAQFFHQPPALLKTATGKYVPNPAAENVENQQLGYRYWINQVGGNTSEWIKVYVLGQYGYVQEGRPCFPEYRDDTHCNADVQPIHGLPLLLGWDFGLTPACVIAQVTPRGQLLVIDELCSDGMGIRQFARDVVVPYLGVHYPKFELGNMPGACDPAGMAKAPTDETTCVEELTAAGFDVSPAPTNLWTPRREAVAFYLNTMIDGRPAFQMSPRCKVLRRGFNGKYHYRRMQVPGKDIYRDEPDKDQYSHPQDCVQYIALRARGGYIQTPAAKRAVLPDPNRRIAGMVA